MKEYTSGKLCRAFRAIPLLDQWEEVKLNQKLNINKVL